MIYTITRFTSILEKIGLRNNRYRDRDHDVVGYYFDKNKALNAVLENQLDFHETIYEYILIEGVKEGLYQASNEEVWFKWNSKLEIYSLSEKPKDLKSIKKFSMG